VAAEDIERDGVEKYLKNKSGLLVAPGFGVRGIEGKILAVKYIREKKIPFLGICLGMQCAVIEFSRNVCRLKNANSAEFKQTDQNVIDLMMEQKKVKDYGGTMRLGTFTCKLKKRTKANAAYKRELINERHRHRYEVNNSFLEPLKENGMIVSGVCPQNNLVEIIELESHPWFVGVQFHPELKSRAANAHPLFREFVKAAVGYNQPKK
jgi:CTP synthase